MTKFLNISTDNTLGGNSASDETVSSQKAIKEYVDLQAITVDQTYDSTSTNAQSGIAVSEAISSHNNNYLAHPDIRNAIPTDTSDLTNGAKFAQVTIRRL